MKRTLRTVFAAFFAVVLLVGVCRLVGNGVQSRENRRAAQVAYELVDLPETPPALSELPQMPPQPDPESVLPPPEHAHEPQPADEPDPHAEQLLQLDLTKLQEINPDVVGWISIPDTPIFYPLLQGEDNEFYLNHAWDGKYNVGGSIFMEHESRQDLSSFNTLIYGHRMSDSSMFNSLRFYEQADYLKEHPYIYLSTETGVWIYEVFAVCRVTVTDPVYWLIADQEDYKQQMIDFCLKQSLHDTGIKPGPEDRLLTLSTCTGMVLSEDRLVVVAVLRKTAEKS